MKQHLHIENFRAAYVPQYQEVIKNKPWVYYGDDNLFPVHLLANYQYSALNRACINAITYGIRGKDLIVEEGDPSRILQANRMESVYDVFQKCVIDRYLFGGYASNIVKSNDGGIAEFYHTDFSRIRAGKVDEFDNVLEYYYSVDWKNTHKYKPVEIPAFTMFGNEEKVSSILYFKNYTPGMSYYPAPDYLGGLTTTQLDIEIKAFHLSNTQYSMMPSVAVSFPNGVPSEEERDIIYRQLQEKYEGSSNGGKWMLFFSESPETQPTITPIQNNASDAWYANMYPQIEQTILSAHRITNPGLLGIKTAGQLGGRQELLDSYELFLEIVIKPIQESMLTEFEKILFMRDKEPIKLGIKQNQLLPSVPQDIVDKIQGV